jgi:hypothetical protein
MKKILNKSRKFKAFSALCARKSQDGKKQSCQKSIKKEDEQKVIFLKFMFSIVGAYFLLLEHILLLSGQVVL